MGAEASVSSFLTAFWVPCKQPLTAIAETPRLTLFSDPDLGAEEPADPDPGTGGSGSVSTDLPESGFSACMESASSRLRHSLYVDCISRRDRYS